MSTRVEGYNLKYEKYVQRWLKKTKPMDLDCWMYWGDATHIYPRVRFEGFDIPISRASAFIFHAINLSDNKQQACHITDCKIKSCWNPKHIYVGDHHSNQLDRIKLGIYRNQNTNKLICKRGHELALPNIRIDKFGRHCILCEQLRRQKT